MFSWKNRMKRCMNFTHLCILSGVRSSGNCTWSIEHTVLFTSCVRDFQRCWAEILYQPELPPKLILSIEELIFFFYEQEKKKWYVHSAHTVGLFWSCGYRSRYTIPATADCSGQGTLINPDKIVLQMCCISCIFQLQNVMFTWSCNYSGIPLWRPPKI